MLSIDKGYYLISSRNEKFSCFAICHDRIESICHFVSFLFSMFLYTFSRETTIIKLSIRFSFDLNTCRNDCKFR